MSFRIILMAIFVVFMLSSCALAAAILSQFMTADQKPFSLAFDGTYIWNLGQETGLLYKFDQSGTLLDSIATDPLFTWATGMDYKADENILLVLWYPYYVYNISISDYSTSLRFQFPFSLPYPNGLADDGAGGLWINSCDYDRWTYKVNQDTGAYLGKFQTLGKLPQGIATDGTYLYILGFMDGIIYKYDFSGNKIEDSYFPLPPLFVVGQERDYAGGLAYGGGTILYQCCCDTRTIYTIDWAYDNSVQPTSLGYVKALMR